jgi:REP element-mobilizing transposase RayT
MERDEAIARGLEVRETRHSMKRRSPWHDYHEKGTYMLTLVVEGRMPLLGRLEGRVNARPGDGNATKVVLSELGTAIVKEEIPKIHRYYPQVEVWKVCIMPDHVHLIVRVKEDLRGDQAMESLGTEARGRQTSAETMENAAALTSEEKAAALTSEEKAAALTSEEKAAALTNEENAAALTSEKNAAALTSEEKADSMGMTAKRGKEMDSLGMVVKGFKLGCNRAYRRIYGMKKMTGKGLFELGYNDKLLLHEGQLKRWKKYLDDNPRRLMVKRMNPELFTVMLNKVVAGRRCQMVGNCFLLDIPDKVAVIVHRRYSEEDLCRLRKEWLACGERGGVLVSAAISIKEKEVLREAMNRGYRIVLLRENGFPQLYKPCGESFDACSEGLLLQISPWEYHMEKKTITREECLELNEMAERIAEGE